jgi:hypothetical protein
MLTMHHRGFSLPALLMASALVAAVAVAGLTTIGEANLRIEPNAMSALTGETIEVSIVVDATSPVNVFAGDLAFDPEVLSVSAIEYNTSIADLWVTRPWYDNGAGTLNFGGGTTKVGGFSGTGTLINITFKTQAPGDGAVAITNGRILRHDGLGSDVELPSSIDSVIMVQGTAPVSQGVTRVLVTDTPLSPDLNADGEVTFADASIMMLNLFGNNPRYDLNRDGEINRADLALVLTPR